MSIKIRRGVDQIKMDVSNYTIVSKLKEDICNKFSNINEKEKINKNKILLFFGGKEMKDEKEIWVYSVSNEAIILLMIKNE